MTVIEIDENKPSGLPQAPVAHEEFNASGANLFDPEINGASAHLMSNIFNYETPSGLNWQSNEAFGQYIEKYGSKETAPELEGVVLEGSYQTDAPLSRAEYVTFFKSDSEVLDGFKGECLGELATSYNGQQENAVLTKPGLFLMDYAPDGALGFTKIFNGALLKPLPLNPDRNAKHDNIENALIVGNEAKADIITDTLVTYVTADGSTAHMFALVEYKQSEQIMYRPGINDTNYYACLAEAEPQMGCMTATFKADPNGDGSTGTFNMTVTNNPLACMIQEMPQNALAGPLAPPSDVPPFLVTGPFWPALIGPVGGGGFPVIITPEPPNTPVSEPVTAALVATGLLCAAVARRFFGSSPRSGQTNNDCLAGQETLPGDTAPKTPACL